MVDIDFVGQVAIVTGAGGGMGRETALLLGRLGASVLVNDYGGSWSGAPGSLDRAESVAAEIRSAGGKAAANGDAVGTAAAADRIRDAALDAFGRIDILINNAGIIVGSKIGSIPDEDIDRITLTNFLGPFRLIQSVWGTMTAQGYGRILNVSSNSQLGTTGMAIYASSKAALIGLTMNAAVEGAASGIVVNSLWPAAATRMVDLDGPVGDAMTVEEVETMTQYFTPAHVAQVNVALVSRQMKASGEHFSTGAGKIHRIAHFSTKGYGSNSLTPAEVVEHLDDIRSTKDGVFVSTAFEEFSRFLDFAIPTARW